MSTMTDTRPRTIATLLADLGGIAAERVRLDPLPGTATVSDLDRPGNRHCELIDATLVEKAVGQAESRLASWLGMMMNQLVIRDNLGYICGEAGFVELESGNIRGPDLAFYSWDTVPGRRQPSEAYPRLTPDLAVEVLSVGNTPAEMERKRADYFASGTRAVWEIDPRARTIRVYTAVDDFHDLTPSDTLDGGAVLPGFRVPVAELFAELDRHG